MTRKRPQKRPGKRRRSTELPRLRAGPGFRAKGVSPRGGTPRAVEVGRLKTMFKRQVEPILHVLPPETCRKVLKLFGEGIGKGNIGSAEIQRFSHYPSDLQRSLIEEAMEHRDPIFRLKQLIKATKVPKG